MEKETARIIYIGEVNYYDQQAFITPDDNSPDIIIAAEELKKLEVALLSGVRIAYEIYDKNGEYKAVNLKLLKQDKKK